MKLDSFVFAYERSLIALNKEAQELSARIARIEGKPNVTPGGRLAARLSLYRYQLASLKQKHRGAACWVGTVAQPLFSIISKRLGGAYQGCFVRDGSEQASLKFLHTSYGVNCSLILQMKMASLCTEPSNEDVRLVVQRLIVLPSRGRVVDDLPLDTSISELLNPLMNA